jgi:hypothetical protein
VFAGAVREAVLSNPDVIRRVNADFVPVALKAGLVNNPPDDEEGRLCREIGRSKIAPQGICVVNSAGKVLAWTMAFDDDKSVLAFLDHAAKRFREYPDAKKAVPAERFMRFPSAKLEDTEDNGKVISVPEGHSKGKSCPAKTPISEGTVIAKVFGRALDKDGKPVTDTIRQEHYVEDLFYVPVETQEKLAKTLAQAGTSRLRLGDDLAQLLVSHAYLGQIDVQPCMCMIKDQAENKGEWKRCVFWAREAEAMKGTMLWRIEGESEVLSELAITSHGIHNVKLAWEGFIEMKGNRMTRLLLAARGAENLQSSKDDHPLKREKSDAVAFLTAGHPIDLDCQVRYGIIGEPAGPDKVAADAPDAPQPGAPEQARRQIIETLGPPFLVFRDKVQEELKLSDEQKKKLEKRLQDTVQDAMPFFQELGDKKPEEREKEHHAYVEKAQGNLTAFLEGALKEDQFKRLRQVMLQREGLFGLGHPEIMKELEITDKQRQQFMEVMQDMQQKMEPVMKEAQKGGKPEEIAPKLMKLRQEHEGKIEAILDDAQKKQWKELLGKPLDLGD